MERIQLSDTQAKELLVTGEGVIVLATSLEKLFAERDALHVELEKAKAKEGGCICGLPAAHAEIDALRAEIRAVKEDEAMSAISMAETINALRARAEAAEEVLGDILHQIDIGIILVGLLFALYLLMQHISVRWV